MPKSTKSQSNKLNYFIKHYGKTILETEGKIMYCRVCLTEINASKRFRHIFSCVPFVIIFTSLTYFLSLLCINLKVK